MDEREKERRARYKSDIKRLSASDPDIRRLTAKGFTLARAKRTVFFDRLTTDFNADRAKRSSSKRAAKSQSAKVGNRQKQDRELKALSYGAEGIVFPEGYIHYEDNIVVPRYRPIPKRPSSSHSTQRVPHREQKANWGK